MATLNFISGKIVSLKDDGTVNAGGKVYFYVADGTYSSALTSYSDRPLTTPNANPLVLDSSGRGKAYISGNADCKITDSADVLIYNERDISPQNIKTVSAKSTNFTVDTTYLDSVVETTAALTLSLTSAATLGAGFSFTLVNTSGGAVTVARLNSGDTINGVVGNDTIPLNSSAEITVNAAATGFLIDKVNISTFASPVTFSDAVTFEGTVSMVTKAINEAKGADVASVAGSTNIWTPADGQTVHITGVEAITDFGSAPQAGAIRHVIADGAFTLTDGANLVCPGNANILCAVDDAFDVYADTTTKMYILNYARAAVAPLPQQSGIVKLNSGTVAAATLDIVMTSYISYPNKILILSLLPSSDGVALFSKTSTDGGSTYDSGAANYEYVISGLTTVPAASNVGSAGDTQIQLSAGTVGNLASEGIDLTINLMNTTNTSRHFRLTYNGILFTTVGDIVHFTGSAGRITGADVDAIRLYFGSGNINGSWSLYGWT